MKMENEKSDSAEFNSQQDIIFTAESGLLDGVGNEVWIGLFSVVIFICAIKFLLDVYICPMGSNNVGNVGNGSSHRNNPGQYNMRDT